MPKLSAAATARALDTRARNRNKKPLYVLARILNQPPKTLAARLGYHGIKPARASLPELVAAVEAHTHLRITAAMRRKIDAHVLEQSPPQNHRGGGGHHGAPSPRPAPPSQAETLEALRKRLRLTVISLQRAERLILPLVPGRYGELQLSVLEALHTAQGSA